MPDGKCGAKTRTGNACKGIAMANGKCRMHGGTSTGPKDQTGNSNAVKHGFYSSALLPEERELMERAEVGGIDDEIKLAKVKLHRLVRLAGNDELSALIGNAVDMVQKREAVVDSYRKPTRLEADDALTDGEALQNFAVRAQNRNLVDKTEIRVLAPNYAELIIKQLSIIGKLELTRMQLRLAEKKLEDDDVKTNPFDGLEVVEYDD